jgi:hypothetical protein
LAHIELLYKTGRIDEVAALLRHSQVFRMAWQTLQQSSSRDAGAGELTSSLPAGVVPPELSGLPAPRPGSGPDGRHLGQDLISQQTAPPESSREISQAPNYPVPASRPTLSMAAGRRVYETQLDFFARERAGFPRFNLMV